MADIVAQGFNPGHWYWEFDIKTKEHGQHPPTVFFHKIDLLKITSS